MNGPHAAGDLVLRCLLVSHVGQETEIVDRFLGRENEWRRVQGLKHLCKKNHIRESFLGWLLSGSFLLTDRKDELPVNGL